MRVAILLILLGVQQNLFAQFGDDIVPFRDGNKWGWADVHTGNVVIEPVYDSVKYDFYKDVYLIYDNSKVGAVFYDADIFNKKVWKVIIEPVYDEIYRFEENVYFVVFNNKKNVFLKNYGIIVSHANFDIDYCLEYKDVYPDRYSNEKFQFLLLHNKEYKGGLFDIKSKKIINGLKYNIHRYQEGFWTDSFKSQSEILLKDFIFKDVTGKYFYLSNSLVYKEVKEGVDFNAEKYKLSFCYFPTYERIHLEWNSIDFNFDLSYLNKNTVATYYREKWSEYKIIGYDWNGRLLASNMEGTKYGILNKQRNEFLIQPKFDKLTTLDPRNHFTPYTPLHYNGCFLIGHNRDKKTFFINYMKVVEAIDEYLVPWGLYRKEDRLCMIYRKENLYGFLSIEFVEEMNSKNKKIEWKLFEPKYKSLEISNTYSNAHSREKVHIFEATDENGETFFVNDKGIEFRR